MSRVLNYPLTLFSMALYPINLARFHAFMYTEEGNKFMDRLWNETIEEFDFPEVHEVLKSLQGETPTS